MITLLKSNIVGARDVVSIMYVELLFDIKTELPDKFYQINGKNFLIADDSLAIKTFINDKNENDTIVYKYNNGRWIKTGDKYTGIITPISTITENGKYSIGSNNIIGTNNIDVNVADIPSVLGEKTITANNTYNASDDGVEGYSKVSVDVPNTYTAQDEGKVVNNGELVAQTAMPSEITKNSTVDTTNYNSVTVNIPSPNSYSTVKTIGLRCYINNTWFEKTWKGLTDFDGQYVWTDGNNIYYSNYDSVYQFNSQYILDKDTSTWIQKTWNGVTQFSGNNVWTDGDNIYLDPGSGHYVLNKSTSTWEPKTWEMHYSWGGGNSTIWTDGNNIYYSSYSSQYIINTTTSTFETKTWNGFTQFSGSNVWSDGNNIYNNSSYVLNTSTSTWSSKTWSGLTSFDGSGIWYCGDDIYYSNSSNQYILNKSTSTWSTVTWNGLKNNDKISGTGIWTDGDNVYFSSGTKQYYIPINKSTIPKTSISLI